MAFKVKDGARGRELRGAVDAMELDDDVVLPVDLGKEEQVTFVIENGVRLFSQNQQHHVSGSERFCIRLHNKRKFMYQFIPFFNFLYEFAPLMQVVVCPVLLPYFNELQKPPNHTHVNNQMGRDDKPPA